MKSLGTQIERPRARALRELQQAITSGRWGQGAMFPSEHELADTLGVSRSTVRVVLKQLETKGLLRSERGRGRLVVGRQGGLMAQTVVLIAKNIVPAEPFRNTGAEKAVEIAVSDTLRASGRHVLSLHAGSLQTEVLDRLIEECPSAVAVDHDAAMLPECQVALRKLDQAGCAVVVHGDMPGVQEFDRVIADHSTGAYELTRWLIGQGYTRLQRVWEDIGSPTPYWLNARDQGFERAMKEAGLPITDPLRVACLTPPVDQEDPRAGEVFDLRARQYAGFLTDLVLRNTPPQVLLAMNDVTMLLAARALRLLGQTPGDLIHLVGYDNFWPQSKDRRFEPYMPLATVDKQNHRIGQEMARLLLTRLEDKLPSEPQCVMVTPRLVISGRETESSVL